MNCDICERPHSKRLALLGPVDARNKLYEKRLALATALIENEQTEKQINSLLTDDTIPANATAAACSPKLRLDKSRSDKVKTLDKTDEIIRQADKLRADLDAARKEIEERKKKIGRRKADLEAVSSGVEGRRARQQAKVEKAIAETQYTWDQRYEAMVGTRGFLCMEAAKLYGLKRIKKGSSVRYELGGLEILDLQAMSSESGSLVCDQMK